MAKFRNGQYVKFGTRTNIPEDYNYIHPQTMQQKHGSTQFGEHYDKNGAKVVEAFICTGRQAYTLEWTDRYNKEMRLCFYETSLTSFRLCWKEIYGG